MMNRGAGSNLFLFSPYEVSRGRNYPGMFLSHFSHADGAHLLFNMVTLYFFGPVVEDGLGVQKMLIIYVIAGILSTVIVYYRHRTEPNYRALGASDSITGILFAAIVLQPEGDILLRLHSYSHSGANLCSRLYRDFDLFDATRRGSHQSRSAPGGRFCRIGSWRITGSAGI